MAIADCQFTFKKVKTIWRLRASPANQQRDAFNIAVIFYCAVAIYYFLAVFNVSRSLQIPKAS